MQFAAQSPAKRLLHFAARHFHWFLFAVAASLVLVRMVPAVYLSKVSSDSIQFPLFYRDVVQQHHSMRNWVWGGHSDLFPDVVLTFLLNFLTGSGWVALCTASAILFAGFIVLPLVIYRNLGCRNAGTFAAALLFFFVLVLLDFQFHQAWGFRGMFVVPMHEGAMLMALACVALFHAAAVGNSRKAFWLLAACCFLASASDTLFFVLFPGAALAAGGITFLLYPVPARRALPLAANIIVSCLLGRLCARPLFPAGIDDSPYTHFNATSARTCWDFFCHLSTTPGIGSQSIFVPVALGYLAFAAAALAITIFRPAAKRMDPAIFTLLVFCAFLIAGNIAAVILTGNYFQVSGIRFIRLALLVTPLLLVGWLNHLTPWSRLSSGIAIAAISLCTLGYAVFLCPEPANFYVTAQKLIPIMREVMEQEHIEAALADYWYANLTVFFSGDTLKVRSIFDGQIMHWVNNSEWYTGGRGEPPPKFRMILMTRSDPVLIRRLYGAPARIVHTPVKDGDLWIYPPEKSIVYDPVFQRLSNDPGHQYRVVAATLPSTAGRIEGDSRIAFAARDREGALTYGPYIHPPGGHYRIVITYAYLAPPAPGKSVSYDTSLWNAGMTTFAQLDKADIPFVDTATHEFTREIDLPAGNKGALEVHTLYHASGDIRVDSIAIIHLGPP